MHDCVAIIYTQMFTAGILNNVETMLFQRQAAKCNVESMLKYGCIWKLKQRWKSDDIQRRNSTLISRIDGSASPYHWPS